MVKAGINSTLVNPNYCCYPPPPPPTLSFSSFEKKFIQIELPPSVEDNQELKARAVDHTHELYLQIQRNAIVFYSWYADVTARIKSATSDPTALKPSQASQEFFEGEKIQKYITEAEHITERLKVSVGNAPAFGEAVRESPKKDDGIDASTRQISEVLSSLANDGGGRGGKPCVESRRESNKADAPTKSVAVSWSQIMEEVGGVTVDSNPLSDASPGLEDQVIHSPAQTDRELLLEAKYTVEEIDQAYGRSEDAETRHGVGDELHEQVHGEAMKENVETRPGVGDEVHEQVHGEGIKENVETRPGVGYEVHEQVHREGMKENVERLSDHQPSDKEMEKSTIPSFPMDTQELMECMFSTVEMKEALCGPPEDGSGSGGDNLAIAIWKGRKKNVVVDQSERFRDSWDMWQESCSSPFQLDSDMVFVPVSTGDQDHYSCICVNFFSEQIEYLDNRSYEDDLLTLPYGGIARITVDEMGKYMVSKGLDKGRKVEGFNFVNIKFNW
ncbi:uncharacterized protein LOC141630169 [Silene latifolia]|uniref:uncharacterized protein LOC141630169 n=1 Tax=Silene latifolia TaxID=37657 RepID=UPI003D780B0B